MTKSNCEIVLEYLDLQSHGKFAESFDMLADDCVLECRAKSPPSAIYRHEKPALAGLAEGLNALLVEPLAIKVITTTSEDDRVAIEAESHSEFKNGGFYANNYHMLFRLRDGKIYHIREYLCTYTLVEKLMAPLLEDHKSA